MGRNPDNLSQLVPEYLSFTPTSRTRSLLHLQSGLPANRFPINSAGIDFPLMKRVLSSKEATMAIATEIKTANKLYSAQDLESISANGKRYALILGELIEMPPAGNEHGMFTDLVSSNASVYAQQKKLGVGFAAETGFKLTRNPDTVLAPDWSFIVNERLLKPIEKSYGTVVPDLVIETRSPGDSRSEFLSKTLLWLDAGVKIVWGIDPKNRTLTVYRMNSPARILVSGDTLEGDEVLPGFTYPLNRLFGENEESQSIETELEIR